MGTPVLRTPPLIVWMSFQLSIPRRVALQQRPPPLPQPRLVYDGGTILPIALQRMVMCPYFRCLTHGVHSSALKHQFYRPENHVLSVPTFPWRALP